MGFDYKKNILETVDANNRNFIVITPEYKILAANYHSSWEKKPDLAGRLCYEVLYKRTNPCEDCLADKVITTCRASTKKGLSNVVCGRKEACLYGYPIFVKDKIEFIVLFDYDEPAMEEMEDRLRRSNAFLRNLINSAVDGVIAADMNGKIIIFNEAASEICGYSVDEALSRLHIKDTYPPGVAEEIMRKMRSNEHGGHGKLKAYRVNGQNKDGSVVPISLNASVVYEGTKEVATIGFFHDMRETIKMQEDLKKMQIQLLQAEKMSSLGKLAAGVAHQLNNPLGGITLFSKLILEDYDLPEGAKKDLKRVIKDAERCRDTVKELLEFARQSKTAMLPIDINRALARTLFLLEGQPLFHNIEIVTELTQELPPVLGDSQQLNHVFMNIILNAADAMEGEGVLTLSSELSEDKKMVIIKIRDTGPGLSEEVCKHIFEPFYTTKDEGKGTGLGLSLAYGIIERHGGHIYASCPEGCGCEFCIELNIGDFKNLKRENIE